MIFLLSLEKENLIMKYYQYPEENIRKVELELFNKTHTNTFGFKKDNKSFTSSQNDGFFKRWKRAIFGTIRDSLE